MRQTHCRGADCAKHMALHWISYNPAGFQAWDPTFLHMTYGRKSDSLYTLNEKAHLYGMVQADRQMNTSGGCSQEGSLLFRRH
jgi:hypothetical protein